MGLNHIHKTLSHAQWPRRIVVLSVLALTIATTSGFMVQMAPRAPMTMSATIMPSALEQMTVKELRQLLKDADLQERGLLSRLKRKQDLVDYLSEHLPKNEASVDNVTLVVDANGINGETTTTPTTSSSDEPPKQQRRRMSPLNMPPEDPASPKEVLFEQLYERYPPLRYDVSNNDVESNDDNDVDIRQIYHPMLRNSTTSDMDVIFVGTASCTPGTTRYVCRM